ncbi:aldehyde dehydrogenase family protein [Streptomyces pinistramenti]|uniref:aldehyde dehydrogenase family protein n=1 Tax=Streptomyces pinistramenti TaxID=2884812 RepID=UPI00355869FD
MRTYVGCRPDLPDHLPAIGPLAALLPATDLAHAVRITNSVPYSPVASVHTAGLDAALCGLDRIDTGMSRINAPSTGVDFHLPFGGDKVSRHGPREQGRVAPEFSTAGRTHPLSPTGAT